jgi:hypothetical protein
VGLVIVGAATWIFILATLVLDFAGIAWPRKAWRGKSWRWMGSGILLLNSVTLADTYANARGWSYPRTPFHSFEWPILLAAFALIWIGATVQDKEPRGPRRGRHSRQ